MGRPRNEKSNELNETIEQSEVTNDAEVTPQYKHQLKLSKEEKQIKDQHSIVEEYYIQNGDKILKCFKKKNGNVVRNYSFKASRHPNVLKEIKQSGQFRIEG